MAYAAGEIRTNSSPLKRSFDIAAAATSEPNSYRSRDHYAERRAVSVSSYSTAYSVRPHVKRRTASSPVDSSMLVQSSSTMSGSFPSFMTVYGEAEASIYDNAQSEQQQYTITHQDSLSHLSRGANVEDNSPQHPPPRSIQRRDSTISVVSYSTDSSPTTAGSTFDSPLIPETPGSPSSSPESASSAMPPKIFKSSLNSVESPPISSFSRGKHSVYHPAAMPASPPIEETRRNVKNLTLNMELPTLIRSTPSTSGDSVAHPFSAPTSPIKEPPRTGRRKPTNLTIRTPGFNELTFGKPLGTGHIPPTPGKRLSIPQPQSSPNLPSLISPTLGPSGGMHLALPNIAQHCKSDSYSSTSGSSVGGSLPSLREEEYQPPKSQEIQERGYTDGPVLVYESGVYLYLEPTAEEASNFDTVINVAKEIKDPFEHDGSKADTVMSVWRNNMTDNRTIIEPQTAMSEKSFKSAFEWPSATSPTTPTLLTPRPSSTSVFKRPEYLHVRWDHNSEILEDLYSLCQIIDQRVAEGKKVLIHCQLGVSRSASLIIAYGLYKGYEKDFHSMYMSVKKRSQWVGPNMSLIYQLTDFRSKCARGDYISTSRAADPTWWLTGTETAKTPTATPLEKVPGSLDQDLQHVSATKPPSKDRAPPRLNKELPPVPPFPTGDKRGDMNSPKLLQSGRLNQSASSPVPAHLDITKNPKRAAPRPLPLREKSHISGQMIIPPHKPSQFRESKSSQVPAIMDLAMHDVPSTPSIFSPRSTEFVAPPFGVTTAGDLVSSAPRRMKPPPGAFPGSAEWRHSLLQVGDGNHDNDKTFIYDPRSPPQKSESNEISWNIDNVL